MQTPYFLLDKQLLDANLVSFKDALNRIWAHSSIGYSVKTNSMPWLLKYLKGQGLQAEVVSDEEYELSLLCGFAETEIIYNGPIKSEDYFINAVRKGSIVNIDSKNELAWFKAHIKESSSNIGIRINVDTSIFDESDVAYTNEGFRFGFSEENRDLAQAIDILRLCDEKNRIGLHFHCNSVSRSVDVYRKIALYAKELILKYNIDPSFIDVGGGFFGGVEGKPGPVDYVNVIYEELKNVVDVEKTKLIVEPGSAIIGSAVSFHTSVIDVKDTSKATVVTTDGSRINIDPLWAKDKYDYVIKSDYDASKIKSKQIICGYTCMDHDRIMSIIGRQAVSIGDRIIYSKVGAYTMTFGGPFIKYFPEVYVEDSGVSQLIRKRMTVQDYYAIQNV